MHNDLLLIFRCQRGDPGAFAELFNKYKNKVFSTAFYFVRNQALADDITQEVFITVFQKIQDLRNPPAFRTWLYRVVVSKVTHLLRDEGGIHQNISLDDSLDFSDIDSDPLTKALNHEDMDILRAEIRNLPDELRLPVIFHYYSGLRIKEIADILGIPQGTVKSRLHTARARLAEALNTGSLNVKEASGEVSL